MPNPNQIQTQINELVAYLVERGLADDQGAAFQRVGGSNSIQVTFQGEQYVSVALKDYPYREIFDRLKRERAYNVKMLDGALIQMMYVFSGSALSRHRLAFFSSPDLDEFQNNAEIYLMDELYADVVARSIVPFPLRFDYDASNADCEDLSHPVSHMTLGQYEACRIPLTAPMTPFWFINFVLRSFYHTGYTLHANGFPRRGDSFSEMICEAHRDVVHLIVPN